MTQQLTLLTSKLLTELETDPQPPGISLCQTTHRSYMDNKQDVVRFENIVRDLVTSLQQKYPAATYRY
jgi:hypothetical protein